MCLVIIESYFSVSPQIFGMEECFQILICNISKGYQFVIFFYFLSPMINSAAPDLQKIEKKKKNKKNSNSWLVTLFGFYRFFIEQSIHTQVSVTYAANMTRHYNTFLSVL